MSDSSTGLQGVIDMFEKLVYWLEGGNFNRYYVPRFGAYAQNRRIDADEMIEFLEDAIKTGQSAQKAGRVLDTKGVLEDGVIHDLEANLRNMKIALREYKRDPDFNLMDNMALFRRNL